MDIPAISKVKQPERARCETRKKLERALASEIAARMFVDCDAECSQVMPLSSNSSSSSSLSSSSNSEQNSKKTWKDLVFESLVERATFELGREDRDDSSDSAVESQVLFELVMSIYEKCVQVFGKLHTSFTSDPRFALLVPLFRHRSRGISSSSLGSFSHGTQELYDASKLTLVNFLESVGIRPSAVGPLLDKIALGFTFNVNPSIFEDETLLRFCRSRIQHNNTKPIHAMLLRTWKAHNDSRETQSPPAFYSAFSMTRYDAMRVCTLLSERESRLALDVISRFSKREIS